MEKYEFYHEYLIAYQYQDGEEGGIGRSFVLLQEPIASSEDIEYLEEYIKHKKEYEMLLITNYQRIRVLKKQIKQKRRNQKNDDTTIN